MKIKLTKTFEKRNACRVYRDLPHFRVAAFLEICIDGCLANPTTFRSSFAANKLFRNEATGKACLAFGKFQVKKSIEAFIVSSGRLDSTMACIVDGLQDKLEIGDKASSLVVVVGAYNAFNPSSADTDLSEQGRRQRGGRKPM